MYLSTDCVFTDGRQSITLWEQSVPGVTVTLVYLSTDCVFTDGRQSITLWEQSVPGVVGTACLPSPVGAGWYHAV